MTFETWFQSRHSQIPSRSVDAVLRLAAEGGTIPFIARYRKEQTGNLDEVAIQAVIESREEWDQILKRQGYIVEEIERQKKLTPELKDQLLATFQLELLEDIYLPFKQKRKTKAALAREAGLGPLADWLWNIGHGTESPLPGQTLEIWAFTFRNEEKGFNDADAAVAGAQDILIERLSEKMELRQKVREALFDRGAVRTGKASKAKPNSKFDLYFDHSESVQSLIKPENTHRYLAMRRGWMEEELSLSVGGSKDEPELEAGLQRLFETEACTVPDSVATPALMKAARMAFKAHVFPSIENEVHKALREVADLAAIRVFSDNARKLLLASPFGPKAVLGVDPGIRTGCKVAVVDDGGKYIASTVIHLQSEEQKKQAAVLISEIVKTASIRAIAVGNGTAGRETEVFLRATLKESESLVPVVMVSESGASVYSASEVAREEFPDLDLTVRGAISIARRLQDPLAELVKVDPKSIGVGQYQHDVSQHALKKSLELVVDSCVNQVGVNINTASYHLLAHVSGIGPGLAKGIVEHRNSKGLFRSRSQLLDVSRFSQKAFEQSAGFLRIPDSENPLDNTGVHPERYPVLEGLATKLGRDVRDLMGAGVELVRKEKELRDEVGAFTFDDIVRELEKPGRDPRDEFVPFQYREDIHTLKDLQKDMICPGIVTNVTNFGAFVDIGVHQDGLVHISQLSDRYVKDPKDAVSPGDRVKVKVLEVNFEKNQISLSIKAAMESKGKSQEAREPRGEGKRSEGKRAEGGAKRPRNPERGQKGGGERPARAPAPRPTPSLNASPILPVTEARKPSPVAQLSARGIGSGPKPAAPKQAFNNAFAGLANLRTNLKPR